MLSRTRFGTLPIEKKEEPGTHLRGDRWGKGKEE
jgi:hypothetical protein